MWRCILIQIVMALLGSCHSKSVEKQCTNPKYRVFLEWQVITKLIRKFSVVN